MKKPIFFLRLFFQSIVTKGLAYSLSRTFFHCNNYLSRIYKRNLLTDGLKFQHFSHDPLVSIVIVNFNSANYIEDFFATLQIQSYQNFELIVVDNGSTDGSLLLIEKYINHYRLKIIRNTNTGFASGCNIGASAAQGELIAFVNTDTLLDKYWLKGLVDGFRFDSSVAAVTSKTLFLEDFFDIRIDCKSEFRADLSILESSLAYPKYFIRSVYTRERDMISCGNQLLLSIPASTRNLKLALKFAYHDRHAIQITIGRQKKVLLEALGTEYSCEVEIPKIYDVTPIINNAGSAVRDDDSPYDRGFGDYDRGQYDQPEYVSRFCGCSVAIRQTAITRRTPFVAEFFAYFEDSELSRYIIEAGHNILYNPRSILRHYHSASSGENSLFRQYLVSRSHSIYRRDLSGLELKKKLQALYSEFATTIPESLLSILAGFDRRLTCVEPSGFQKEKETIRAIAIYNSFWNTYGGGEVHAINVVRDFVRKGDKVFFVSENDFDVDHLFSYFGVEPFHVIKTVGEINSDFTEKFDIFINATYCSCLISKAKQSFYIISFPHKSTTKEFTNSYYFLCNSPYTEKWVSKYWGSVEGRLRLPLDSIRIRDEYIRSEKEKVFIVVGRFCTKGHKKRQLEIANAFLDASESIANVDWKLIILGSLDINDNDAKTYYDDICTLAITNKNIEVHANVDRTVIQESYARAAYLISATGLSESEDHPELFEHFGIAVLEGLSYGCAPIVHMVGGPAYLAEISGQARLFSTQEELTGCIDSAMSSPLPDSDAIVTNIKSFIDKQQLLNSEYIQQIDLDKPQCEV